MPPQLTRLLLLTIAIVAFYAGARYLLVPPSFGQYGWYRGDALREIADRKPVYAGKASCQECHGEVLKKLTEFEHKGLSCEGCHGDSKAHVENPDIKTVKISDHGCLRCHERDPGRPAWLKQINSTNHYTGERCIECHMPHQPNEVP